MNVLTQILQTHTMRNGFLSILANCYQFQLLLYLVVGLISNA